jgi:hypothetical protein
VALRQGFDAGAVKPRPVGRHERGDVAANLPAGPDRTRTGPVVGYPEIVRAELDIPEELSMLCALAVGYADPDFAANKLKIGREPIGENAVFLDR